MTLAITESGQDLVMNGTLGAMDAATGGDLASVVEGFLSLARLSQETRSDPTWHAMITSAKVTRNGAAIGLSARASLLDIRRSAEAQIAAALEREAKGK